MFCYVAICSLSDDVYDSWMYVCTLIYLKSVSMLHFNTKNNMLFFLASPWKSGNES